MVVLAHIKEQSRLSLGSYALPGRRMPSFAVRGRPRMTEELKDVGVDVGHRRVGRLMRENGIIVERTRKFKATTDSDHTFNIALNLLDRDFTADRPNQKWAGDISYIWTREGWRPPRASDQWWHHGEPGSDPGPAFPPRDLLGRQQPHEARSGDPGAEDGHCLARTAQGLHLPQRQGQSILFAFAIGLEPMAPSMAHYRKILREHGFKASMSGKGNCYDNAAVETFFKTIKAELIWRRSWETRRQAETAIFQYINGFYNPRRRHSTLGGKSPLAFDRQGA